MGETVSLYKLIPERANYLYAIVAEAVMVACQGNFFVGFFFFVANVSLLNSGNFISC